MAKSKQLINDDSSGFEFVKEILDGDPTCAINFDRLQKHPEKRYMIFEYLLCEEVQTVTPHTSHPNKYWHKNSQKFISLFNVSKDLPAKLVLVNYDKKGTKHEDKVKVIVVKEIEDNKGITKSDETDMTREGFKKWFRQLNRECCE